MAGQQDENNLSDKKKDDFTGWQQDVEAWMAETEKKHLKIMDQIRLLWDRLHGIDK